MYVRCVFIQPVVCNMSEEGGGVQYIWRSREMHVDPINSAQVVRVMHLGVHIPMGAHMCLCPTNSMQMVDRRVHIYS